MGEATLAYSMQWRSCFDEKSGIFIPVFLVTMFPVVMEL